MNITDVGHLSSDGDTGDDKMLKGAKRENKSVLEIAKFYYLLNDEERALNYIEQILEKEPTHIQALKLLKEIFLSKNALTEAEGTGIRLIDKAPRKGAEGLNIAFLHPKSTLGVLTELCENPNK